MSEYGWKTFIKAGKKPQGRQARAKTCRACGKAATIGNYCDTCRAFIADQKKKEGGSAHGKA